MDAKEARRKSLEITGYAEKKQYTDIKADITLKVDSGKMSCYFYKSIMPSVKIKLEGEGYKISSYDDQREGTTVTISW